MVRVDFFKTSRLQEVGIRGENQGVGLRAGASKLSWEFVLGSRSATPILNFTPVSESVNKFVTLNPQTLK